MMAHTRIRLIFLFLIAAPLLVMAEDNGEKARHPFRIGFVRSDLESSVGLSWYESLKRFLLEQPEIRRTLENSGYNGIAVLPAEGYRDMLQRMDVNEFDLVFCSSVIFVEQNGDYQPILQARGDIFDSRGQGMTLQKGVIVASRNSLLHRNNDLTEQDIKEYLSSRPMAFVSPYSAPGYIYPRLAMWRKFEMKEPGDYIFCGSSEEVVKYVASGLAEIGACEYGALEKVIDSIPVNIEKEKTLSIVLETPPAPTSPVAIRERLHPRKSELGRTLKGAVKIFYNNSDQTGVPRMADSRDENFRNLKEEMSAYETLIAESAGKYVIPSPGTK
mgnify:CR=1 FL=1